MNYISILTIVASVLSIIGSSTIIGIYFKLGMRQNIALKLITYLSISDLIFSISNLIYINPGTNDIQQVRCLIQGFLLQFATLSCFTFCFLLCLCIYWTVIKNRTNFINYQRQFQLIGFGVPLLFAIIPLATKAYGSQIYVCGFSYSNENVNDNHQLVNIEAILLFFIPLWMFGGSNIYFIIRVILFLSQLRKKQSLENSQNILYEEADKELQISQQITSNMLAYPIIMLVCWSGGTVYAIGKLFNGYEIAWLQGTRFIMADCLGLCNSIAYIINTILIMRLRNMMAQQDSIALRKIKSSSGDPRYQSFLSVATSHDDFLS